MVTVKDGFNIGERKWINAWSNLYPDTKLEHQVKFYIPDHRIPFKMDFLHVPSGIVIEISGGVHSIQSIRRRDYMRTRWLLDNGYLVYTFDPADLTKRDIGKHCKQIYEAIKNRLVERDLHAMMVEQLKEKLKCGFGIQSEE